MNNLTDKYDIYRQAVESIRGGDIEGQLIGRGSESNVWLAEVGGAAFAIKMPIGFSPRGRKQNIPALVESRAKTALRGYGVRGLEQIAAASPSDGALIYNFISGISMDKLDANDANSVSDEQLNALLECIKVASEEGIMFDGWNDSGGNAIFSTENGITLLDFWSQDRKMDVRKNTVYAFRSLGKAGIELARRIDESLVIAINRER
jgi:hypothetical protein